MAKQPDDELRAVAAALSSAPSAKPANFDASDTNFRSVLVPLYEASILSAAVAAAIERAAEIVNDCVNMSCNEFCGKYDSDNPVKVIRALHSPDGLAALRKMLSKAVEIALINPNWETKEMIVDRVLKGE